MSYTEDRTGFKLYGLMSYLPSSTITASYLVNLAQPFRSVLGLWPAWVVETICACTSYRNYTVVSDQDIDRLLTWVSADPIIRCNALCTVRRLGGDVTKLLEVE